MTQDKVDMYIMTNQKYLPAEKVVFIKQKLLEADEDKFNLVCCRTERPHYHFVGIYLSWWTGY